MSTRRRGRAKAPALEPWLLDWLRGGDGGAEVFFRGLADLAELWAEYRDAVVAEHVEERPGTRPLRWWQFTAREPRQKIGGTGREDDGVVQEMHRGMPLHWRGIDPARPPAFESEATYLQRLGLLSAVERRRLPADAWDPEPLSQV